MTGLERLRELADDMYEVSLWAQIHADTERKYGASKGDRKTVNGLLRAIADQIESEQDERVTRRVEDREAAEWVREMGGVEAAKARTMPEGYEWPRFEDDKPVRIGDKADRDGECFEVRYIGPYSDGSFCLNFWVYAKGERVKRPAPKVLDADGAEIRVGDTVYSTRDTEPGTVVYAYPPGDGGQPSVKVDAFWHHASELTHRAPVLASDGEPLEVGQTVYVIANGKTHHVTEIDTMSKRFKSMEQVDGSHWLDPMCFTHQRPVLDADGVPIRVGDEVYGTVEGGPFIVTEVSDNRSVFVDAFPDMGMHGSMLTHTKPEPDSWSSVWTDVSNGNESPEGMMRRCRALAGRGER